MKKYIVSALESRKNTAASKAKEDIIYFLKQDGFEDLQFLIPENRVNRVLFGKKAIKKVLKPINSKDLVVFQYPTYSSVVERYIMSELNKLDIISCVVIHDLESLRFYRDDFKKIEKEISFLNNFDFVISHNKAMTSWLRNNGIKSKIFDLEIFDYADDTNSEIPQFELPILVAGNLEKSRYLEKLSINKNIDVFGINPATKYPDNINYKGAYSPEELNSHLKGSFGIVWDGDAVNYCSGIMGEYLKYNNPHKTSLYLSLGIPVIIWEQAALAQFIKEKGVGVLVNDLSNLDHLLSEITPKEYSQMVSNAEQLSKQLRNGHYIRSSIINIYDRE